MSRGSRRRKKICGCRYPRSPPGPEPLVSLPLPAQLPLGVLVHRIRALRRRGQRGEGQGSWLLPATFLRARPHLSPWQCASGAEQSASSLKL